MAAVQPTTGMAPVGGNPGMKQGAQPLMGISKEQAQALHQEYMTMKQNGTPESDPRLIKVRQILTTLHQRREQMKRLQEAQQQQQQQAQQQQQQQQQQHQQYQQNGAVQPQMQQNGNSTGADAMSNPNMKNMLQSPSTSLHSNMGGLGHQTRPAQGDAVAEHGFSKEQMAKLRAQMAAYGALQKNNSIPSHIAEVLFSRNNDSSISSDNSKSLVAGSRTGGDSSTSDVSRHQFETFTDPHGFLLKHISYSDHAHRPFRPIIPSIMPHSFDPEQARAEREAIIYNRVIARKDELSKLSANIGGWDTKKSDTPEDNANAKLRALIEYKMLCLLPKQREMRAKVGKEMMLSDTLSMTANRTMYRRVKRQSLREARVTEKLEKQQRDAAESKEKKKHIEYMQSIISHSDEIRDSGVQSRQRAQKLGRLMVQTHSNIEKEEQRRIERTAKQRLQALKANDEETYLKLLGQAKDTRITHLLKQTDGFLGQLAASVKEQQRSSQHAHHIDQDEPLPEEDEPDSEDETKRKIDYYEVAHRIKEPVTKQADMLIGGTLKDYQVKGLQWMISLYNNNLNGILADEMGLGKTIQTISLICYLIEKKKQQGPYLVLVPLSTLTNWNNEFEKWAPNIVRIVYKGPPNQRKVHAQQIRYGQFQVLLTTYEFVIKDRPLLSKVKWLHMIVDEGHRMKNANSKLSSTITQYYHTRFRLILTGTPLQNNLTELWAMLNFVLPNIFKSVKSFDEWFNTPFANTGGQDKMELTEEEQLLVIKRLHKVLRPFLLRRLKKDVEKDLPDKQERVVKCNRSALQARLYKQLVQHNRINVLDSSGKKTGMRGLSNMLMQLRKLCNHPFVFEAVEDQMNPHHLTNDLIWRTSGKFELLDRVLPKFKATNHRVLMFFQMTQIMNIMEDFLRFRGIKYLRLDGSTKADDRSELLRLFNAPGSEYFCFLLSTRAGGLGLNLQTADTVIIYDSDWNPHQDLQAQDRAHRIGQKNEVRILRLITSNSVEEKILERAQFKLDMDGKVIQAGKFDNKSTNEERDEMLRIMLEAAESSGETVEQEDEMDDDELNMIMARNEDEVVLFQKMDQDRLKNDQYGPDKTYQRLLGDSELPELYLNDENPVVEEIETNYGRGTRERAKVKYDDGLTEEQWLDAVDADDDTIEAAIARKQARIARRNAKKAARANGGADSPGGDDDDDSDDASEEEEIKPQPKKRGRKTAGAVAATPRAAEKRKAVDDLDSPASAAAQPPKKRGRVGKAAETLSKEDRESLQTILDIVHDSLQDLEEASTEPGVPARGIIDPFLELPPKQYYPDYYDLIKNPICMKQIENKINRKQYQNVRQFREDLGLLCRNCRQYNEDGSVLYQDANLIESAALEKLTQETAKFPRWKNFDQPEAAETDIKAAATDATNSAVGTPQPPARTGIRLKLGGPKTPAASAGAKGDEE